MSVSKMKKITLMIYNNDRDYFFDELQKVGIVHFDNYTMEEINIEKDLKTISIKNEELDYYLSEISDIIDFLSQFKPKEKTNIIESLNYTKPNISNKKIKALYNDFNIDEAIFNIKEIERNYKHILNKIELLKEEYKELEKWRNYPIDLDILNNKSEYLGAITGIVSIDNISSFKNHLKNTTDYIEIIQGLETPKEVYVFIIYHKSEEKKIEEALREESFIEITITKRTGKIIDVLQQIQDDLKQAEKEENEIKTKIVQNLVNIPILQAIYDYLTIRKTKSEVEQKGKEYGLISLYNGWFPAHKEKELIDFLKKFDSIEYLITDPEPSEDVPIELVEKPIFTPFELITRMYGLPVYYKSIDPTPHLSPFYFIFYGMCLSDFFYGLIQSLVFGYLTIKTRNNKTINNFMKFLFVVGISTMFFGIIFGSYFGDLFTTYLKIEPLPKLISKFTLIEPLKSPMVVLYYSLLIGAIQLLYGLFLRFLITIKENVLDGIFDVLSWIILLIGIFGLLILIGVPSLTEGIPTIPDYMIKVFLYMSSIGAIMVIINSIRKEKNKILGIFTGLYSLYSSTSYLGDLLSYARLLALGIGTGVIAMVVNFISNMLMSGLPELNILSIIIYIVRFTFGLVIFVGVHLFNIIISAFGAFIHSARLQYVEFFSKFYSSGGKEYSPFRQEGIYYSIKNE